MSERYVKIAVLVSGGGTNLQALIDAQEAGIIKSGRISLVISNKAGAYALERAKNAGIEGITVTKKKPAEGSVDTDGKVIYCDSQEDFEAHIAALIKQHGIDLIVLAGFMSILSEGFTTLFANRIINVHPALIPSFCGKGYYGLKVHEAALKYGVKVTGATVHFVNEVPDGGRIIAQKAVEVKDGDTPEILQKRVMEQAEWIILPASTEKVCRQIKEGIL
jgi:phosphoribosylglycinamide formyltransferase-1